MSARWATTGVFFVNGAVIGTWVAHIPWIQQRFELSNGPMGLVLAAMSLAVILTLPVAGQAVARHGSERITWIGGLASVLVVNATVLAPHPIAVVVALFALGAAGATMDIAMNAHGVHVERMRGRAIMSSLHAGWSLGGAAGAGFAAALAALGADPRVTVAMGSALLLGALLLFAPRIGAGSAGEAAARFTLPGRGVVVIAVLCLLVMLTEGAMADWGGLYLRNDLGASQAIAALAFTFFTVGMTAGRVVGDRVNDRIGPVALLRGGALLTGAALAAMLLIGHPGAALAGLFLVGLGVANGVPLMFSAAGRRGDTPSGPAIAAVSSMGSLGFLAGPPAIGFLAEATSLPVALASLTAAAVAVFVAAGATAQPRSSGRRAG